MYVGDAHGNRVNLLIFLAACDDTAAPVCLPPPKMGVSETALDFGLVPPLESVERIVILSNDGFDLVDGANVGVDMGIGSLAMSGGDDGQFCVRYDPEAITCPNAGTGRAKADTGGTWDTGPRYDTGGGGACVDESSEGEGLLFVLGPGCSIPLTVEYEPTEYGDHRTTLEVQSVTERVDDRQIPGRNRGQVPFAGGSSRRGSGGKPSKELSAGILHPRVPPSYYRDPRHFDQLIPLHGGARGDGIVYAEPAAFDFGAPPADGSLQKAEFVVRSLGDSPVVLGAAMLDAACPASFSVTESWVIGKVLLPDESEAMGVVFTPTTEDVASCTVHVTTDDGEGESVVHVSAYLPANSASVAVDDDLDGFTEVQSDCDDTDAARNPDAREICDDVDSDCDGLADREVGCVGIGEYWDLGSAVASVDACVSGEVVTLQVPTWNPEGVEFVVNWQTDADGNARNYDDPTAATTQFNCPRLPLCDDGKAYNVYMIAYDPEGHQSWSQRKIDVFPTGTDLDGEICTPAERAPDSGCGGPVHQGGDAAPPGACIPVLGLGVFFGTRRLRATPARAATPSPSSPTA